MALLQENNGKTKIPSKMASLKVEICLKKKNPPRVQIFRYFRIESRNNKSCKVASYEEANLIISFSSTEPSTVLCLM